MFWKFEVGHSKVGNYLPTYSREKIFSSLNAMQRMQKNLWELFKVETANIFVQQNSEISEHLE